MGIKVSVNTGLVVLLLGLLLMAVGFIGGYFYIQTEHLIAWLFVAFIGIIATLIGMAMLMGGEKKE